MKARLRRLWQLLGLAVMFLGIIYVLVPRKQPDPYLLSYIEKTGRALPLGHVVAFGLADSIVYERVVPALEKIRTATPEAAEVQRLNSWFGKMRLQHPTAGYLYLLLDSGEAEVIAATVDTTRQEVTRVINSWVISQGLMERLLNCQQFFRSVENTPFRRVSSDVLRAAMRHPDSIAAMAEAIRQSEDRRYSEIGGLVFVEYVGNRADHISVRFIPGRDEAFTRQLIEASSDLNRAIHLLATNAGRFDFMQDDYAITLRELRKPFSVEQRMRRLNLFLDLYGFMSKMSYEPSEPHYMDVLSQGVRGEFVAGFHVHPLDNLPSAEDKAIALTKRMLVLVPRTNGFDLFDLYPGLKDFDKPEIIAHRDQNWSHPPQAAVPVEAEEPTP